MDLLALIMALSVGMWYIIDRFKPCWSESKYGKYITVLVSAIFGFGLAFSYQLDLVYALELVEAPNLTGQILTGFVLMSGSSAVSEIIGKIKV